MVANKIVSVVAMSAGLEDTHYSRWFWPSSITRSFIHSLVPRSEDTHFSRGFCPCRVGLREFVSLEI